MGDQWGRELQEVQSGDQWGRGLKELSMGLERELTVLSKELERELTVRPTWLEEEKDASIDHQTFLFSHGLQTSLTCRYLEATLEYLQICQTCRCYYHLIFLTCPKTMVTATFLPLPCYSYHASSSFSSSSSSSSLMAISSWLACGLQLDVE